MKKIILTAFLVLYICLCQALVMAQDFKQDSLRKLFLEKKAVFYAINIRTFGAVDTDGDEIINIDIGERRGSFLNAVERLDELKKLGINTIYLLPITKTGKLKALGTAGSLYSMDSFDKISPLLDDKISPLDVKDEAKIFIDEAHKKGFYIVVDLPSCGSYDMTLEKPSLFLRNKDESPVIPSDWTDVRLFKTLEKDNKLNDELLQNYKLFIDLVNELNIDGIRADVAGIKPKEFWIKLINYARLSNPQMLFIAEASNSWNNPIKKYSSYLSVEELLQAGFDGYYGEYMNFLSYDENSDFINSLKRERKIINKFDGEKATLATFATHDQLSPILDGDPAYSKIIIWLSTTLPTNSYYLDGFSTGDKYIYDYENKKANKTSTDDEYYFVHRGKFDIFNFSRRPGGETPEISEEMTKAYKFRTWASDILSKGKLRFLKTGNKKVLAYLREYKNDKILVVLNMDYLSHNKAKIHVPKLKKSNNFTPVKGASDLMVKNNDMFFNLENGEIAVYAFSKTK